MCELLGTKKSSFLLGQFICFKKWLKIRNNTKITLFSHFDFFPVNSQKRIFHENFQIKVQKIVQSPNVTKITFMSIVEISTTLKIEGNMLNFHLWISNLKQNLTGWEISHSNKFFVFRDLRCQRLFCTSNHIYSSWINFSDSKSLQKNI